MNRACVLCGRDPAPGFGEITTCGVAVRLCHPDDLTEHDCYSDYVAGGSDAVGVTRWLV